MDSEIMDDICCATCFWGELCQDVDTGYYVHCKNDNEDHSEDEVCGQYGLAMTMIDRMKELQEYKQMKNKGRLILLPCKIGDTLWCITSDQLDYIYEPIECVVASISISNDNYRWEFSCHSKKKSGGWSTALPDISIPDHMNTRTMGDFGKTVFLTREEAETALIKERVKE